MSVYTKINIKNKKIVVGSSASHRKNNSINFSKSTGKIFSGNQNNIFYKKNIEASTNPSSNTNTENNLNNKQIKINNNINKLLTSTNLKNRRIEIDLDKDIPNYKFNNSARDNIILLKHKQSASQNNIINQNKNNVNNINININISKKIVSTYYNKSKNTKNLVVKKGSINSMNNSKLKKREIVKYYKANNKDNIYQNPSEAILRKYSNKNSNLRSSCYSEQNKNKLISNSLYFSTNNNLSENINKNNIYNKNKINSIKSSNIINRSNYLNYTNNDIYKVKNNQYRNLKKNNVNVIKDNKSLYLTRIQIPMNVSFSPKNINSIQNYFKYLGAAKNKNYKNNLYNNKKKLSANNIKSHYTYNKIENKTLNNENQLNLMEKDFIFNNISEINKNKNNLNFNSKDYSKNINNTVSNKIKTNYNFELDDFSFKSPEELHYFLVQLIQKGKDLNFDFIKNKV